MSNFPFLDALSARHHRLARVASHDTIRCDGACADDRPPHPPQRSQSALKAKLGKTIDGMDFVIRFNYFQIKGGAAVAALGTRTVGRGAALLVPAFFYSLHNHRPRTSLHFLLELRLHS